MGRLRLNRLARARTGLTVGAGMLCGGLWLWFGLPVAVTVGGALVMAYSLLIADVAEPVRQDGGRPW